MMLQIPILVFAFVFAGVQSQDILLSLAEECVIKNGKMSFTAKYTGNNGNVTSVEWAYSGKQSTNLVILAGTCAPFGTIDAGYPPASRMTFQCLPDNTFTLLITNATEQERRATWGAGFSVSQGPPLIPITTNVTLCIICIITSGIVWLILCSIGVALKIVCTIFPIVLIIVGRKGKNVKWGLSRCDIAVCSLDFLVFVYSLIVGAIGVSKNDECRRCTDSDIDECNACLGLCGTSIALSCVSVIVLICFIIIRQGWCEEHCSCLNGVLPVCRTESRSPPDDPDDKSETCNCICLTKPRRPPNDKSDNAVKGWCGVRFTCLNTVLPVCKNTEARGPPDGKSDHPAAKEKHREVKRQIDKEQTHHPHRETELHKGRSSGEKHDELSKGQPRPLPVPTGNNRPMPDIPSDRHRRGLSANFHDEADTPLDDNILHTLPDAKKSRKALDPVNTEGQSKNPDDQPKKKKKKKKNPDTSRSEEMEDNIDSHGKVLEF